MLYLAYNIRQVHCSSRSSLNKLFFRHASSKRNGPSSEKLKAIPFAQHVKAAEKVKYF